MSFFLSPCTHACHCVCIPNLRLIQVFIWSQGRTQKPLPIAAPSVHVIILEVNRRHNFGSHLLSYSEQRQVTTIILAVIYLVTQCLCMRTTGKNLELFNENFNNSSCSYIQNKVKVFKFSFLSNFYPIHKHIKASVKFLSSCYFFHHTKALIACHVFIGHVLLKMSVNSV